MRWFGIRQAKIDPELRKTFEQYGTTAMQIALGDTNYFIHKGETVKAAAALGSLLPWLTEQYDRTERKETWSMTMEFLITIFVATELYFTLSARFCR
jgi:hypothetical protein